jgi:biotin synthase-related radical SAM superfamily protein
LIRNKRENGGVQNPKSATYTQFVPGFEGFYWHREGIIADCKTACFARDQLAAQIKKTWRGDRERIAIFLAIKKAEKRLAAEKRRTIQTYKEMSYYSQFMWALWGRPTPQ